MPKVSPIRVLSCLQLQLICFRFLFFFSSSLFSLGLKIPNCWCSLLICSFCRNCLIVVQSCLFLLRLFLLHFFCCFGYFTIKGGFKVIDVDLKALTRFLSFLLLFIGGIARPTSPSTTLCMPRATLPALLGGVKLILGQCEIGTDHNRVAAGQVSVKRRHDISNCFSSSSLSRTYLRNWRNIEVQPLLSCFNVR